MFATAVLLLLLHFCEVKRPKEQAGAIGSIELMVAMAVPAIATFNINKSPRHFVFSHRSSLLGSPFAKKMQRHNILWHFLLLSLLMAYLTFFVKDSPDGKSFYILVSCLGLK
jgi:hypothetical protein